jgi:hypothetical protein
MSIHYINEWKGGDLRRLPTCIGFGHPLSSESVLKRRSHEAIAIARALKYLEMDGEHGHIE